VLEITGALPQAIEHCRERALESPTDRMEGLCPEMAAALSEN